MLPASASAELTIKGIDDDLAANVRAYVTLADEPCSAEAWLVRRRFRTLESEARQALEPFGYYDSRIRSSLTLGEDCWKATLDIRRGDPVRLRNVEISITGAAADDERFRSLLQPERLASGMRLQHAEFDRYKRALQVLAAERGYLDAAFTESRLDVWPDQGIADAKIDFDSGIRYRMGEVRQEQDFLDPELVAGYIDLRPGALFDSAELARAHRDLSDSGYFGRVEVVSDVDAAAGGSVPIRVAVEPGIRTEYTVGAGVSTDTGIRLRGGFRNNRLNPHGHRLKVDADYSPVIEGMTGEYRIPLADPRAEWLSYTGAISSEDTDTFENDRGRIGLRFSRRVFESWIRTLSLDFDYEKFDVGGESDSSSLLLPGIQFAQKQADRDAYPTRGRHLGIELRGAGESFGSTTTFVQVTSWARWIRGIGNGRLIARSTLGFTHKSDFEELPPSVRFFAGGDESIRGYDYESLGPTDDEGNVIGGSNLVVASLEYEHRLRGNFYGAVFVDAGNAFDDIKVNPEVGAGFGIKWRSPIGPVRAYVGFPVTLDDRNPRFHLRLGPDL